MVRFFRHRARRQLVTAGLLAVATGAVFGFELSDSYAPGLVLTPGTYACRSGLDFDSFTAQFEVDPDGGYNLRGQNGAGRMVMAPATGAIDFDGGPFMSDDIATTSARNAVRLSDGNAVIIIRYDFGSVVTDDYCALLR